MAAYTTIDDPSAFFKCQLYTGNGSANHAITFDDTDTDMQPDLVWIKNRDATDSHCLFDSVRGATKLLVVDTNAAEVTDTDTLDSFASDGFQVDADVKVNTNTEKYASWNWKAGTTSGITTDGNTTITPSAYSFDQTHGFSIIKYTGNATSGAKVAHGLGATPGLIILKDIDSVAGFPVFHKRMNASATPWTHHAMLHDIATYSTSTAYWNDTAPDSVNFTLGNNTDTNKASTFIGYCWVEKQGYSKFGVYEGNDNADGTFVYCGFRPAYICIKNLDQTEAWFAYDTKRMVSNHTRYTLKPSEPDVEQSGTAHELLDILSNGFKLRYNTAGTNDVNTHIFFAFAESPFVNS